MKVHQWGPCPDEEIVQAFDLWKVVCASYFRAGRKDVDEAQRCRSKAVRTVLVVVLTSRMCTGR